METRKKVLLTGASGTVGYEVLKQIYNKKTNYKITVFDVKSSDSVKKFAPFEKDVEIIYGDITNEDDLDKICSEKDYVIHLAAIIPPLADEKPELSYRVNTLGTENLILKLEKSSPKVFFLYSSSISIYGDRLINPYIKVHDPLIPSEGDEYARTKIEAENIVQNCKLDWSIFRLCAIMGGHRMSKLMFHQPLKTSLEIATAEDTARAFINAIDKPLQLSKKIFNLGGGESCRVSYDEFLSRSFKILGLGKPDFPQKAFAEKNFHCGYYEDGIDLEKILNFRKDSIEDYFEKEKLKISPLKKFMISIFRTSIKRKLLKQSEPFQAYKTKDEKMLRLYFGDL